ncbi:MAG: hypothetical protein A3E25_19805 [Burkholderiales bacterium RIFCSPHIGHO2_12_FULL_69_20]|nr:MAG: hypothetical protein A3E25_19805 [Burkholderiales bacterium RIFCSPHIGHO2_12_FULL_69_20]
MSLALHLQGLRARFDTLALRAPTAMPDELARLAGQAAAAEQLLAWCHRGAEWQQALQAPPVAPPVVDPRLAVGALHGPANGDPRALAAWADAFARQIDGSHRLEALPGRAAGLAFRLGVKLHDAMGWRPRQPTDPWDAGWVVTTPAALHRLQTVWTPRRATLLLADAGAQETLRPCLTVLGQRSADFRHPVRWLWVGGGIDRPAQNGLPVQRFNLA